MDDNLRLTFKFIMHRIDEVKFNLVKYIDETKKLKKKVESLEKLIENIYLPSKN